MFSLEENIDVDDMISDFETSCLSFDEKSLKNGWLTKISKHDVEYGLQAMLTL